MGLLELHATGAGTVHSADVRAICAERLDEGVGDVVGRPAEVDDLPALNDLSRAGLVTEPAGGHPRG